jgi:hypothetical protein
MRKVSSIRAFMTINSGSQNGRVKWWWISRLVLVGLAVHVAIALVLNTFQNIAPRGHRFGCRVTEFEETFHLQFSDVSDSRLRYEFLLIPYGSLRIALHPGRSLAIDTSPGSLVSTTRMVDMGTKLTPVTFSPGFQFDSCHPDRGCLQLRGQVDQAEQRGGLGFWRCREADPAKVSKARAHPLINAVLYSLVYVRYNSSITCSDRKFHVSSTLCLAGWNRSDRRVSIPAFAFCGLSRVWCSRPLLLSPLYKSSNKR